MASAYRAAKDLPCLAIGIVIDLFETASSEYGQRPYRLTVLIPGCEFTGEGLAEAQPPLLCRSTEIASFLAVMSMIFKNTIKNATFRLHLRVEGYNLSFLHPATPTFSNFETTRTLTDKVSLRNPHCIPVLHDSGCIETRELCLHGLSARSEAAQHYVVQSDRMSKNTNDGITRSGTGCFIAVPIWQQWASKG